MFALHSQTLPTLISSFTDKDKTPDIEMLKLALGHSYNGWQCLYEYALTCSPKSTAEWKFSGQKFGWSFRISDKKRVLIYFLPRDGFFKAAFVFGQKAVDDVLNAPISEAIKDQLLAAKPYAEGRGVRIDVTDSAVINDIKKLLAIKVSH